MSSYRLDFIRENKHLTDAEITRELGISGEYLDAIRYHNGIEKHNWKWTDQEDAYLKAKYGKIPYKEVYRFFQQEFGRSIDAVQKRACKLGLT